ncbi:MAG: hypothetical protein BGO09_00360 [Bacteroidetes bacterium 47-18]|nr:MAG: hypothetical protein BGO09_00360 [Bacteroidetes bacterium 47-18]
MDFNAFTPRYTRNTPYNIKTVIRIQDIVIPISKTPSGNSPLLILYADMTAIAIYKRPIKTPSIPCKRNEAFFLFSSGKN